MLLVHFLNGGGIILIQIISSVQINMNIQIYSSNFPFSFFFFKVLIYFVVDLRCLYLTCIKPKTSLYTLDQINPLYQLTKPVS